MFCGQCGEYVQDTNKFCTKCGAPISPKFRWEDKSEYYLVTSDCEEVDYTNHHEMVSTIKRVKFDRVLVDLGKVKFIDSVGVGSLVTLAYTAARKGQEIKIVIKSNDIMKSIRSLGVDNILDIYETCDEAIGGWGLTAG